MREDTLVKIKDVKKSKPLYKQFEEKYQNEIEMPQLEQKKKQLEELRSFYKPLDKKELTEHAQKYEHLKSTKLEEIRRSRELTVVEQRNHVKGLRYKPSTGVRELDSQKVKMEEETLVEEKKKLVDKVNNYAKYVKEMYWPKVSESKVMELQQIKENLGSQKVRRVPNITPMPGIHSSIQSARNKKINMNSDTDEATDFDGHTDVSIQPKKIKNWGRAKLPPAHPPVSADVYKSMDYLKEMRSKRFSEDRDGVSRKTNELAQIDKLINDPSINEFERLELIKQKADIIEQRAVRDEQLIKSGGASHEVERTIAVNEKYIDAITAKLKILDQI